VAEAESGARQKQNGVYELTDEEQEGALIAEAGGNRQQQKRQQVEAQGHSRLVNKEEQQQQQEEEDQQLEASALVDSTPSLAGEAVRTEGTGITDMHEEKAATVPPAVPVKEDASSLTPPKASAENAQGLQASADGSEQRQPQMREPDANTLAVLSSEGSSGQGEVAAVAVGKKHGAAAELQQQREQEGTSGKEAAAATASDAGSSKASTDTAGQKAKVDLEAGEAAAAAEAAKAALANLATKRNSSPTKVSPVREVCICVGGRGRRRAEEVGL
jgi:hypothetical protein